MLGIQCLLGLAYQWQVHLSAVHAIGLHMVVCEGLMDKGTYMCPSTPLSFNRDVSGCDEVLEQISVYHRRQAPVAGEERVSKERNMDILFSFPLIHIWNLNMQKYS